ncbi:MAG: c-type cytochrome biogenesis protein CcsB [Elusimicrobia bacterium]|nr:c-type cytochrome biogenesis protein CcsB [Elusimicrobiota bacterium]
MELTLFAPAAVLYGVAAALAFVYLFSRDERWSLWALRLLAAGVAFHLASFGLRMADFWAIPENRWFLPVNSFYGALSFLALSVAAVALAVERGHRLGILGAFVLPWAALAAGGALWRAASLGSTEVAGLVPALRSYWMNIHPAVLMVAYAAFSNAAGVGVALLIQDGQIKSRRPTGLCYRLPAIAVLDDLCHRINAAGFLLLTVGIIMGGIWAYGAWGRFWGWDPKETWSLITAVVYAAYLHLRYVKGWRGRRAVYMSLAGFACVCFTFIGVNFLSGLHGYLSGR